MRFILVIALTFLFTTQINAQDKNLLAKVYFKRAVKSYEELNLEKTKKYLNQIKEVKEGIVTEDVAVFGSKFYYEIGDYNKAEEYFKAFFDINKDKQSATYKSMLLAYTSNLDAKDNPVKVNQLLKLKKEKEKQDSLNKIKLLESKKTEIVRLQKSITALEKSLSYISDKNSSQYTSIISSINKMKEKLKTLGVEVISDTTISPKPPIPDIIEVDEVEVEENILDIVVEEQTSDGQQEKSKQTEFVIIEEPPVFPGCENMSSIDAKRCLSKSVQKHFSNTFNVNLANELGLSAGLRRINIVYTINKQGYTENIITRAPHPKIEEEVIRVMKILPKMKPGTQRGKTIAVKYAFTFSFNVE